MAKEGFDWIWCEHALTVGYRSSLTEIVQIIGRATRDAPGKTRARFTNLIAEPDAREDAVTEAVNDTLKAIAASLLMEQVLAPRFEFTPKNPTTGPEMASTMARAGMSRARPISASTRTPGRSTSRSKAWPSRRARKRRASAGRPERSDHGLRAGQAAIESGLFDEALVPEELTQLQDGQDRERQVSRLDEEDQEAVRQHAVAALNLTQKAQEAAMAGTAANRKRRRTRRWSTASASSRWTCANWTST